METCLRGKEILEGLIGKQMDPGKWFKVKQEQINLFAEATGDHQWIHVDPERAAAESPYKVTIAHGYLTVTLMGQLVEELPRPSPNPYEGVAMEINYGLNKVRFPAPVKVDSRIRVHSVLLSVEAKGEDTLQLVQKNTIEVQGQDKPGCVAEAVSRLVYG